MAVSYLLIKYLFLLPVQTVPKSNVPCILLHIIKCSACRTSVTRMCYKKPLGASHTPRTFRMEKGTVCSSRAGGSGAGRFQTLPRVLLFVPMNFCRTLFRYGRVLQEFATGSALQETPKGQTHSALKKKAPFALAALAGSRPGTSMLSCTTFSRYKSALREVRYSKLQGAKLLLFNAGHTQSVCSALKKKAQLAPAVLAGSECCILPLVLFSYW